jgi:hypothetical protein
MREQMIVDSDELREAIRERDAAIARVRAVEAGLAPLIEKMWAASARVEELAQSGVTFRDLAR